MRKIRLVCFLLLSVFLITSCTSDDGDLKKDDKSLLLGKWINDVASEGDITFYENGKVEVYYDEDFGGKPFTETGKWELNNKKLKIFWDEADEGLEVYDTQIFELSEHKLKWKVLVDKEIIEESFTKK